MNKSPSAMSGSFPPTLRYRKQEIHKVFLRFRYLDWTKSLLLTALTDLIRASPLRREERSCFGWRSRCFWWWPLSPICISRRKRSIDNLKIAMFRHQSAGETTCQEERPIHGITRYLQEHLAEEVSLGVLAE